MNKLNRRAFIRNTSLMAAAFGGLQACVTSDRRKYAAWLGTENSQASSVGYGPLRRDPQGIIDLPKGFSYAVLSQRGEIMDDGFKVPGAHDGMAAFSDPSGHTILVRNHELNPAQGEMGAHAGDSELWNRIPEEKFYDYARGQPRCFGGTTTLVFDTKKQKLISHSLSLTGTIRNCSGGPTPWGSWITCEEAIIAADGDFARNHGYNFEVPAKAEPGLVDPVPLTAMGRFNHEAIAVDPLSGAVYETEDRPDGLIYRYLPNVQGQLVQGGRLQALAVMGSPSRDTRNWPEISGERFPINQPVAVEWIDLDHPESPLDDLRYRGYDQGAARFARGEGMFYGSGEVYFACTNGGQEHLGQIFRYRPSPSESTEGEANEPGTIELFVESHSSKLLQNSDNLTVAPWGDVIICEDDGGDSSLIATTPEGKIYHIGQVRRQSELAGVCVSPDASTVFVNLQREPGMTLAITGPWLEREA